MPEAECPARSWIHRLRPVARQRVFCVSETGFQEPPWAEPLPGSSLMAANCSVLRVNSPGPFPARTCLQSPGWTWEVGEVFAASFPPAICGDSGWTYFCRQVLLLCHPHGHCSPPLPPSGSKDLLGFTDLRFESGGMFEDTSCQVTMLWHLPACMLNLDVYSSVSLLTGDTISAHLQISGDDNLAAQNREEIHSRSRS